MIKLKDLIANSSQKGHISQHHPAAAFAPTNTVQEGPAEDDMKSAEKLRHGLEDAISIIDKQMIMIDQKLSSFNSPGLKHAFTDALKAGLKRQGKFEWKVASKRLKEYYKKN